jgi:hypothetical protein
MEIALLGKIIFALVASFISSLGSIQIFNWTYPKSQVPAFLKIFGGALPFILIQTLFSLIFWEDLTPHPKLSLLIISMKFLYLYLGIFYLRSNFKEFKSYFDKSFLSTLAVIFIIYLPSLILASSFHPSYDSDVIVFWFQKLETLLDNGFTQKFGDSAHLYGYSSFLLNYLSLILPKNLSSLEVLISTRFILCFLTTLALWGLCSKWNGFWKIFAMALLLSGFPIKWINLYQDLWVACFILYWFKALFEDLNRTNPLSVFLPLALLAGIKNEGGLYSLFLSTISLWHYRKFFIKTPVRLAILLNFSPFLIWKICTLEFNQKLLLESEKLNDLEFKKRLHDMAQLYWEGLGRHYQSFLLDGTLSVFLVLILAKKMPYLARLGLFCALVILILPLSKLLWTSVGYDWLLHTTFSRITMPASLLGIYIFLSVYGDKKSVSGL